MTGTFVFMHTRHIDANNLNVLVWIHQNCCVLCCGMTLLRISVIYNGDGLPRDQGTLTQFSVRGGKKLWKFKMGTYNKGTPALCIVVTHTHTLMHAILACVSTRFLQCNSKLLSSYAIISCYLLLILSNEIKEKRMSVDFFNWKQKTGSHKTGKQSEIQ